MSNQYMIIERFKKGKQEELYRRFEEVGRLLPKGVHYIDSWINVDKNICFQLMRASSIEKIQEWTNRWKGYAVFEVFVVVDSQTAKELII